jgi:hypothetical protein
VSEIANRAPTSLDSENTNEIEITPEMIKAGIEVMYLRDASDWYGATVRDVFVEMEKVRRRQSPATES